MVVSYLKNRAFIRTIPKTDLHLHLDGSIRIETLIELARSRKVTLPSYSEEGLRELVFKERYRNLAEYLEGFKYTVAVLQDAEALEQVSYEIAWDNINEGVCYIELRFAPQLHIHPQLDILTIMQSVNRGLQRAKSEYNNSDAVKKDHAPYFNYGIIVCAMRMFTQNFSYYYQKFVELLQFSGFKQQTGLASLELARAVVHIRDQEGVPIVGFDLAGQEDGYPAIDHKSAYEFAHQHFLKKTVHAGEAYGPESIFQAITELHADRLGHAYHLFSTDLVQLATKEERIAYTKALSEYIADRRITIEVCLTSNLQTLPFLPTLEDHSFRKMLHFGLSVVLCTDNRTISATTVTDEIEKAIQYFNVSQKELKNIIIYGFKRSFYPGTYTEKRKYVRQIIDYYERVEQLFSASETEGEPIEG